MVVLESLLDLYFVPKPVNVVSLKCCVYIFRGYNSNGYPPSGFRNQRHGGFGGGGGGGGGGQQNFYPNQNRQNFNNKQQQQQQNFNNRKYQHDSVILQWPAMMKI